MAFDSEKKNERVNILCLVAQGICHTTLAAKYILNFEDIKANCAFVGSLCNRAGCEAGKSCIAASKCSNGKDFNVHCQKSLRICEKVLKSKLSEAMVEKGMEIPEALQDSKTLEKEKVNYIH